MHGHRFTLLTIAIAASLTACGVDSSSSGPSTSAATTGAATAASSGTSTSAATTSAATSGSGGAGGSGGSSTSSGEGGATPLDGYGALTGTCGEIDLEDIESPVPELFQNQIDFAGRPDIDPSLLSPGGQEMYAAGNLNQSSLWSEVFAYEVLWRCEGAVFLKGESEIVYATEGKKTDLLVEIDGEKVGVSVVRAESFPEGSPYPVSQAETVLEGKLSDILQSSVNVAPEDAWQKQILSVIAQTPAHAQAMVDAYALIDDATKSDTIVVITDVEGDDTFVFYN